MFFDIRSTVLWDAGRIPGAHFMPKPEVTEAALAAIAKKADPIVFYCQGIKCPNSAEACSKAVSWGYTNVYYYRDGYPAWQAAGLEIE
ncbi:MAG: rhodanese-like domain-containing protein [Hyphomicrobiales bacterium]|nr:rhodanese-like domain-containing protein [Hyphomicrobiales bacterium]